ncbi:SDR family NAD(P)-dependent oxidoreductase [Seohaeicola saemankumensis]|uniref:SDR family NAD(P)-dependent oxidoreductase n=1 Tax=Seohaeicola saemankumensis TaxID=481181 RepID=UPI0035D1106C
MKANSFRKSILITGAGTGIGRDTAKALVERGHKVYATTHHDAEVASLRDALGGDAEVFRLEITDPQDRAKIAELDIDVLINNAGQGESGSLAEIDIDRVRRLFEVNLFSSLELTQIAIGTMIERGGGTIIFISSAVGRIPFPFLMPYGMTKFALSAAASGLRSEMRTLGKGIHVSVIEPGAFHTGFNQRLWSSRFEWMDNSSIFSASQIETMKSDSTRTLRWIEAKSTVSIVNKIVSASEAKTPRLRYVAPWYMAIVVRLLRILGA